MEKRKFFRFNVNLPVRYRILESLQLYKITSTEDMCERGIKIILPEYIEPGTFLELTVKMLDEPYPIKAIGRVVWVKKDAGEKFFNTGLYLVYITEKDKQKFYKYALL